MITTIITCSLNTNLTNNSQAWTLAANEKAIKAVAKSIGADYYLIKTSLWQILVIYPLDSSKFPKPMNLEI